MKRQIWLAIVAVLWAVDASAQPVIDGTADAAYGPALSIQDTRTQFGDGVANPDPVMTGGPGFPQSGGSELDQVFATVFDGRLYVTITGNLEENFNKLHVFIDSGDGSGVNQIRGSQLPGGHDGFCCGGFPAPKGGNENNTGGLQRMNGLKFDNTTDDPSNSATLSADYLLTFTHGRESVGPLGDYNGDGAFNAADYTVWRDNLGKTVAQATAAANPDGQMFNVPNGDQQAVIGDYEYAVWKENYGSNVRSQFWALSASFSDLTQGVNGATGGLGMQLAPRGEPKVLRPADANNLSDYAHVPSGNPGNTDALLSPYSLTGLGQGELIDRSYALGDGGCADDGGDGCDAREFEFALDVDPAEIGAQTPNLSSHRNFDNFVDLRMALNNSNTVGVRGSGGPFELVDGVDDPEAVVTGLEFSIPLSEIGSPSGNIRILAFINGSNMDYISNQVSGDGVFDIEAGTGQNLMGNFFCGGATPDTCMPQGSFNDIPGEQFVTVVQASAGGASLAGVPEPASAALVTVGILLSGMAIRRRQ